MRFVIGFLAGVAAGFLVGALMAGEDNPLALFAGKSKADS